MPKIVRDCAGVCSLHSVLAPDVRQGPVNILETDYLLLLLHFPFDVVIEYEDVGLDFR